MKRPPIYIENYESWEKEFTYYTDIKVRFSETDAFGHVNNTVAFVYFEQARIDFLEQKGIMKEWLKSDEKRLIVTADLQCNYHAQIKYGDQLKIGVKVDYLGTSSMDVHYIVKKEEEVCLTGRGTIVQIDAVSGKAAPFSEAVKTKLSAN
ncbi:thioesterase superfamily [Bacillus sp. JCM 19046]|nr:thioesterase superfamily [Bacillus sp. JCM 19045]GAF16021.1 thioesterase superfamily [Bacillus sp. JCM 19046]